MAHTSLMVRSMVHVVAHSAALGPTPRRIATPHTRRKICDSEDRDERGSLTSLRALLLEDLDRLARTNEWADEVRVQDVLEVGERRVLEREGDGRDTGVLQVCKLVLANTLQWIYFTCRRTLNSMSSLPVHAQVQSRSAHDEQTSLV